MSVTLRTAGLLALLGLALAARSLAVSHEHPFPVYDEPDYLELAQEYAARGGILPAILCHWRVECRNDNRNPLYLLALTPFMSGGPEDFAKMMQSENKRWSDVATAAGLKK